MQFVLLFLFALKAAGSASNSVACQNVTQEIQSNCLRESCDALLTTGAGSGQIVRDPRQCQNECTQMARASALRDDACQDSPLISPSPEAPEAIDDQTKGQAEAAKAAGAGNESLKTKQAHAAEAQELSQELQKKRLESSNEIINRWDSDLKTGVSQTFPADRAKWESDRRLVREAERARAQKEIFPVEKANEAHVPAIRGNLRMFSRAQSLEKESTKDLSSLALAIAKLTQMKSTNEENAAALGTTAKAPSLQASSRTGVRAAKQESLSSLTTGKNESELSHSPENPEKLAKNANARESTHPLASRSGLKSQLRELLRQRMNDTNSPEDFPQGFLGDLGAPAASAGSADPAKEDLFLASLEEEAFHLSGSVTDAEIRRLRSELTDELEEREGVLPSDSKSLFARVKAAHDACAAKKCVVQADLVVAGTP